MIKIEHIKEPNIEFSDDFLCDDPKMGISTTGFYSLSNKSHKSEIHYAVIGTKASIEKTIDWISEFSKFIESGDKKVKIKNETEIEDGEIKSLFDDDDIFDNNDEEIKEYNERNKRLNPDFPGFNKSSCFKSEFLNDETNNFTIKKKDIDEIIKNNATLFEKQNAIIELYYEEYINLIENSFNKPDICFVVLPSNVFKKLGSIPFGKQKINFRRKLKAKLLEHSSRIPTQIILEETIAGTKKQMQDKSMVAWNFSVAQYYKTSNSIPWILTEIDKNSCFVGISFHKIINSENNILRSSVAQAFNREGKGLIFVGKQFEWNVAKTKVAAPHLTYEYANELIKNILTNYIKINKHTPSRVVIHKTTDFWNYVVSKDYSEVEGIREGVRKVIGNDAEIDFVTIKSSKIKLLRTNGIYPVLRGTLMKLDDYSGILYTTGYIPYYETFPGMHIPMGLEINITHSESSIREISKEILALTKLNFNNCNYYDSLPITIRFAQKVGEIIQYLPDNVSPPTKYYYYM